MAGGSAGAVAVAVVDSAVPDDAVVAAVAAGPDAPTDGVGGSAAGVVVRTGKE